MSPAARISFVFAGYLILLGIVLLVIPNVLLALFAYPTTSDVWIRVVGMLLIILAFYYIQAARHELIQFFVWTVYGRAAVIVFFFTFVMLGLAQPTLILFGVVDLLSALWTASALRAMDRARH